MDHNRHCALWAAHTLKTYLDGPSSPFGDEVPKFCVDEVAIDMLTDLRHLCDLYGLDFAKLDKAAREHYCEEAEEDAE